MKIKISEIRITKEITETLKTNKNNYLNGYDIFPVLSEAIIRHHLLFMLSKLIDDV
uniref:Uncharacterized protein n=1 Tax=Meloidogyne enterolobii TaxID=390850 RepID=A0A6V7VYM2_MELEN|nr:unnamed protein product [Meloidogyne enterolobii]